MNIELDRQIAILKGATHDLSGNAFTFYTESDSKALELVDEWLQKQKADRPAFELGWAPMQGQWVAEFWLDGMQQAEAWAPTRPEAICRAYIAAVTWMRGRG